MADGWQIALAGVVAFVVVVALVPLCRRIALAKGIFDQPQPGKRHNDPTPYLGGVSIAVGAVVGAFLLPGWGAEAGNAALILAAACLVAVAGLFDDVRGLGPAPRLVAEVIAASLAVAAGARVHLFGDVVDIAISIIWLVVITNAFNLLDNMDSAASVIAATIATALAVTALLEGQVLVGGLAVAVAAACFGFLVYNWHPASIFMGDAGSLFLGFLLAVISLKLRTGVSHFASAVAVFLLVGPAVLDTTLVVISRTRAHRPIYVGGTDHTSHRLILLGLSPKWVTSVLVAATAFSAGMGVAVAEGAVGPVAAAVVVLVPGIISLFALLRVGVYGSAGGRAELSRRVDERERKTDEG